MRNKREKGERMSKYLVKLKPVDAFFFGGEKGFGFNNGEKKLQNNIVKSKEFPQQTSILGMIRKEILNLHGCLKEKWDYSDEEKKNINQLIGEKSFNVNEKNQKFGIINKISPVFVIEETKGSDKFLIKVPKDHNVNGSKYTPFRFNDDNGNCLKVKTNFADEIYLPIDFEAKKGLSEDFIDTETGDIVGKEKVFIKDCSIGIKLDKNHKTDHNSLFRLEKYKFKYDNKYGRNDKCFAFILDVDEKEQEKTFENHKNTVILGGEGSYFFISFEKVDFNIEDKISFIDKGKIDFDIKEKIQEDNKDKIKDTNYIYKIILLSDTYISKDIYAENCTYSISTKVDFKNLKSEKYSQLKNQKKPYYKRFEESNKYSLLEKGSVLFATEDNYSKLIENINNSKFQKIGYNIFI